MLWHADWIALTFPLEWRMNSDELNTAFWYYASFYTTHLIFHVHNQKIQMQNSLITNFILHWIWKTTSVYFENQLALCEANIPNMWWF